MPSVNAEAVNETAKAAVSSMLLNSDEIPNFDIFIPFLII
ncbi:hypothetical protein ECDEC2B_3741 [Escherichia coli DEC2B]|uniref:Uncharacterized protein n=1 Tax=Escherichia coli DEC2D TaxID=868141 RepID=A0A828U045_ECOLX|nr:hypothetical protein EC236275_4455 [Escherichia coli 2362-75]EFW69827.1 hypothetical protein EcoM_02963 [Escherichia coli WV_060327]EFZ73806.1 hypothetical protein ECRN5871_2940 [Escherichia coli RN587/1]EHU06183.1 hypothetical protein ECDEC1A_3455 [Escherichia coli DEC1A]EHU06349.1 hypothetical protein ECDEC1C_3769 [Escherichia coli DEC1C]EHU09487.1 hypothetical protein ECDEC1B_3691 [Escherichia coli DEC1B]EHU19443.1 hypothetical protein ECDEC1D_3899 [Escherichia coli DEC1D]EHU22612.1 hy